jgi:peptide/nickel transport system substrate-binding protein
MRSDWPDNATLTRRVLLKRLLASGVGASFASMLTLPQMATVLADTVQPAAKPRRGGRIRVASTSSSTADTLDPARGSLSTDYARHYMVYSGLTQYDSALGAQLALA